MISEIFNLVFTAGIFFLRSLVRNLGYSHIAATLETGRCRISMKLGTASVYIHNNRTVAHHLLRYGEEVVEHKTTSNATSQNPNDTFHSGLTPLLR